MQVCRLKDVIQREEFILSRLSSYSVKRREKPMALVLEISPEAEARIRRNATIRGMSVTDYITFLVDRDECQSEQGAEARGVYKSTEDQSAELNGR